MFDVKRQILINIDNWLYSFLEKKAFIMPKRFTKWVAHYYTDARIRKLYWDKLGVSMGENTYPNLGFESTTNGIKMVTIGSNVSIGPNVTLITESSANNGIEINEIEYVKMNLSVNKEIVIEDEVWLGANVTILPGVRVGRCTVIGAGSVVTRDVESYSVYAGVPARLIRKLI